MVSSTDPRELRLHFDGPMAGGHMLPAEVLVNSIEQLQRIVHLLAKERRGQPAGQRLRVSADIKERFGLICKVPITGGYTLPVSIGSSARPGRDDEVIAVAERFQEVSASLASDGTAFEDLVPDAEYRHLLVATYNAIQPPSHLDLELTIEDGQGNAIMRPGHLQDLPGHRSKLAPVDPTDHGRLVGTLVRMEFAKRSIALEYRGRLMVATYAAEAETALLDHPRGLIQVRGNICYDTAGEPISIAEIDEVAEVDESAMDVEVVVHRGVRYVATPPLRFDVAFDRADALYDLQGPFHILLSADSREELADALEAELHMLFADYADEDPAGLASDAKELREQIRSRFGIR